MAKPKYPHMRIWETAIMTKYHEKVGMVGEWTYDVHLKVRETPMQPHHTPNEVYLQNRLTAKRIDAVCERKNKIYVIEIKDRLRPSALGQALTYKTLYEEQYAPQKQVQPVILTEYQDLDMQHVCDVYNVEVWIV